MKNQMTKGSVSHRLQSSSKKMLMMFMMVFGGVLASSEITAQQNKPVAALSTAGILQLPTNVALASAYQVDISHMQFATEKQAVEFFASHKLADVVVRPIFSENVAVVMLQLQKHPSWTVEQWNAHLASVTAAQPLHN
jgi:hypothetical protein